MLDILEVRNRLTASSIESAISDAAESYDASGFMLGVENLMRERTLRGEFLDGSSAGASDYQSAAHKKLREKEGFQTGHVDLRFTGGTATKDGGGRGQMLDEMASRSEAQEGGLSMEIGYIEGLSGAEATKLANYHNSEGAGTDHFKRVFIGVTEEEEAAQVAAFVKDFSVELRQSFQSREA